MLPYLFIGCSAYIVAAFSVMSRRTSAISVLFLFSYCIILSLFVGLRMEVGKDWNQYIVIFDNINLTTFLDGLFLIDPGYGFLNILAFWFGLDIYAVNLVCAAVLVFGILKFSLTMPYPWLVMAAALPHLVTSMAMDHVRQATALGFVLLAMAFLYRERLLYFVFFLILAVLFHRTAVILLGLGIISISRNKYLTTFAVLAVLMTVGLEVWGDRLAIYQSRYIEREWDAQGAVIRLLMTALPSVLFLLFKHRISLPVRFGQFVTFMAWGSIVCLLVLPISPSTVVIDRVAKYFIPVQMLAFPLIISLFSGYLFRALFSVLLVAYFATTHFYWLQKSQLAQDYWIPYKSIVF